MMNGGEQTAGPIRNRKYYVDLHERKVLSCCQRINGVIVRGYIDRVPCRNCGKERWNDGRKCGFCQGYQNPDAGIFDLRGRGK